MKRSFDMILEQKSVELVCQQFLDTLIVISESRKHSRLSEDETQELIKRYKKKEDVEALEKIVKANMSLVYDRVKAHFTSQGKVQFDELVQEGMVAIVKAVNNYNPETKAKFSVYLWKTVNGMILNYVNTGRSSDALEYSDSLDRKIQSNAEESEDTFMSRMKSNIKDAASVLADIDDVERLKAVLDTLPEKKRKILGSYFGLGDSKKKDMPSIADEWDMSVPGVSLVISRALKTIKERF